MYSIKCDLHCVVVVVGAGVVVAVAVAVADVVNRKKGQSDIRVKMSVADPEDCLRTSIPF